MDRLKVEVSGCYSGDVVYEDGEYIFNYKTENSDDFISLTMPVREKGYIHKKLHPIFEMNLPEGYLLSVIKKHFSKLVKTDDFGLLKVISSSVKGRVTYQSDKVIDDDSLTLDELLHPKDSKLFDELLRRFALTSALSGVQPKVLARVKNRATLKLEEYIVKSWDEEYPELALNEYFCMRVIKLSNIPVSEFFISDDEKLFIMKRFDITDDGFYLGFEDMCVLQAKQRDDKYEGTYEQIAKTIKTFVSSRYKKISLINFYKMVVINNLVKNGDGHLKNFGLIYSSIDDIKLAPAYDVVSTILYIKNDIPALHLLGSKRWWGREFLIKFGVLSCDLTQKEARDYFDECLNSLTTVKEEIKKRLLVEKEKNKREILTKMIKTWEEK
jgi:serine/threonine-protein kinase HipA